MLADFAKGSGRYSGGRLYYHEGNKPTPADIGALGVTATAAKANLLGNTNLNATFSGYIAPPSLNWWGDCGIGHSQMVSSGNGYTGDGYVFKIGARDVGNGHAWIGMTNYGDGGNLIFGANSSGSAAPVWATVYSTRNKPTAADVGLGSVNNWAASDAVNLASDTTYATAGAVKKAYDLAATKLAANDNAVSATKLATARQINGTTFDGSGNITTANWGTARTLTIGNSGKSVNGAGNVAWSLSEIGAARARGELSSGAAENITTDQFVQWLKASGAFNERVWIARGLSLIHI